MDYSTMSDKELVQLAQASSSKDYSKMSDEQLIEIAKNSGKSNNQSPMKLNPLNPTPEQLSSIGLTPEKAQESRKSILPLIGGLIGAPGGPGTMAAGAGLGEMLNQGISSIPGQSILPSQQKPDMSLTGPVGQTIGLTYVGGKLLEGAAKAIPELATGVKDFVSKYTPGNIKTAFGDISKKGIEPFYNNVRTALVDAFHTKGNELGSIIDDLSTQNKSNPVNISKAIESLRTEAELNPKVASLINRVQNLKSLVTNFADDETLANMSLKDSQELLKSIKSEFSYSKLQGQGIKFNELPIFRDVINEIRISQYESLPESLTGTFKGALKDYGQAATDYRALKTPLNRNNFVESMKSNFGGDSLKEISANRLIPDEARRLTMARQTGKAINLGKKTVLGLGVEEATRKLLFRH
jgi:hypothetical protein